jgi:hypothetical protein
MPASPSSTRAAARLCPFDEGAERRDSSSLPTTSTAAALRDDDLALHPRVLAPFGAARFGPPVLDEAPRVRAGAPFDFDSKMLRLSPGTSSPGFPMLTTQCTIGLCGPAGSVGSPTWSALICLHTLHVSICSVVRGRSVSLINDRLCGSLSSGAPNSNVRSQPDLTVTVPGAKRIASRK